MGWKNWSSWLKGGIISIIITIIISGFSWILFINNIIKDDTLIYTMPDIFLILLSIGLSPPGNLSVIIYSILVIIPIGLFFRFLLGAIIGWIIGKRKAKQQPIQNISR